MNLFVSKVVSSIIQIILFSLIPFVWWLVTRRKVESFWSFIGLKKVHNAKDNKLVILILDIIFKFLILSVFIIKSLKNVEMATSVFYGLRFAAIPAIIIYAVFNTALPEEIVFRGFLLKRISNCTSFTIGNLAQGVLFGLMHGVMFFFLTGPFMAFMITLFTGLIGIAMGYVNEKKLMGQFFQAGVSMHRLISVRDYSQHLCYNYSGLHCRPFLTYLKHQC